MMKTMTSSLLVLSLFLSLCCCVNARRNFPPVSAAITEVKQCWDLLVLRWVTAMGQKERNENPFPSLPFSLVGLLRRVLTGRCCARWSIKI